MRDSPRGSTAFVFYFACHVGDTVDSVYCLKLTVVRVMYCWGKNLFSFVFSYILDELRDID